MNKPPDAQLVMPFVADIEGGREEAQQARMIRAVEGLSVQQLRALSLDSRRRGVGYFAQLAVDEALAAAALEQPDCHELLHGLNAHGVFERPVEALVIIQPAIRFTVETAETRFGHVAAFRYGWGQDHDGGSLPRLNSPAYPTIKRAVVASLDELAAWLIKSYAGWPEDAVPANLAVALGLITERRWAVHLGVLSVPAPAATKASEAKPKAKPARRRAAPASAHV